MLQELRNVRQRPEEGKRRWFADDDYDLIVWYTHEGKLTGFQLCYGKRTYEHAITWRADGSMSASRVDGGDMSLPGPKRSAVLVADERLTAAKATRLAEDFRSAALEIDSSIAQLVYDKLTNPER